MTKFPTTALAEWLRERKFRLEDVSSHLLLLLAACAFVTVFSYTTSPVYRELGDTPDSPIFQIIGKYWAEGAVPYRDLWDMKGPFIFLVNAVGYAITGTRTGVFLLQIVSLFVAILGIFRLFCLRFSRWSSFGLTLLSLAGLAYVYEGGNLTEEYLLPLLAWSFYGLMKWVDRLETTGDARHPWAFAGLYGAVLGLSLMSRLTNALGVCAAVVVVGVVMLGRREFRHFGANVAAFLMGFLLTTGPFFAYFYSRDALAEMWNATFVYALDYAGHPLKDEASVKVHYFVLSYLNSLLLMAVAVGMAVKRRKIGVRVVLWFFAAAVPFVWFCQGNGFGHYGMIVYPLFAVGMLEMRSLSWARLPVLVAVMVLVGFASKIRFMHTMYHWENAELDNIRAYLKESPEVDRASFAVYNCSPNIYLDLDVRPAMPVFSIQDQGMERIPAWREFVVESFRKSRVEWVVLSYQDGEKPGIQEILDENYVLLYENKARHLRTFRAKWRTNFEPAKK